MRDNVQQTDRACKIPFVGFSGKAIYKVCFSCVCSRFLRACIRTLPPLNEPLVNVLVTTRVGRYVSIYGQTISRTFFFLRNIRCARNRVVHFESGHAKGIYCLPRPMFFTISSRGNQKRINKFSTRSRSIVPCYFISFLARNIITYLT